MKKLQTNEIRNGRLAMIACLGCFGQAVMTTKGPFANLLDHLVRRGAAALGVRAAWEDEGEVEQAVFWRELCIEPSPPRWPGPAGGVP